MSALRRLLDAVGFASCGMEWAPAMCVLHAVSAPARPPAPEPREASRRASVHRIDVRQTAKRRYVAELIGTPYWSAGPTRESAVGALVLVHGERMGVGICADEVPFVRVARPM